MGGVALELESQCRSEPGPLPAEAVQPPAAVTASFPNNVISKQRYFQTTLFPNNVISKQQSNGLSFGF